MFLNNGIYSQIEILEGFRQQIVPSNSIPISSEPSYSRSTLYPPVNLQYILYVGRGGGLITPGKSYRLEVSLLQYRSQIITSTGRQLAIRDAKIKRAIKKVLRREDVLFQSDKQRKVLEIIIQKDDFTLLVVVLPTGGRKSLLFIAPAYLDNPSVTVIVVLYYTLLNRLLQIVQEAGIDYFEQKRGEVNLATLVFVSADVVQPFISYT